jgi:Ca2+-binding EF-hand superfamily protein
LDSKKCTKCGAVFIADDVVDILRNWLATTGITIPMLFKKFDTDGDGQIDSSELKTGLLSLNLADLPPSQIERLIDTIDADGDGRLDLGELHATITGDVLSEAELSVAEKTIETDNDTISDDSDEEESENEDSNEEHPEGEEVEEVEEETSPEEASIEEQTDADEGTDEDDDSEGESIVEDEPKDDEDPEDSESEEASDENAPESNIHDVQWEEEEKVVPLIRRIADAMDDQETSPISFFNALDRDADGGVDVTELTNALTTLLGEEVTFDDVENFLEDIDEDGDRTIDMIEFIAALEALDDADEATDEDAMVKQPKPFPTDMQKRMMGKQWNDIVWPLIHLAFGLFIALWVLNGFGGIGPTAVDGTGGPVELDIKGYLIHPDGLVEGDIYPCDPDYQEGDCKNSLTPLAGESSSMPAGFYWDGLLFIVLGTAGLIGSLYAHLILMGSWRERARAMKEVHDDQADAAEESDVAVEESNDSEEDDDEDSNLEEEMTDALEEDFESEEIDSDEEEIEDKPEEEVDEEIDIGSHIGLSLEDEEVYGVIIEFDDEDETVTIKEDGTGEEITGYQEDIFLE